MQNSRRTLLGSGLSACFFVVAYVLFCRSVIEQEKYTLLVSAFLYFCPILVDCTEDLEAGSFSNKYSFIYNLSCTILGLIYLAFIFYCFHFDVSSEVIQQLPQPVFIAILIIPIMFFPKKIMNFCIAVTQAWNRNRNS